MQKSLLLTANIKPKRGTLNHLMNEIKIFFLFKQSSDRCTSSMGSSSTCGKHGARTPIRNGVGEQQTSSILAGNTGTKVCCQVNGYSSASTAWPHLDNTLQMEKTDQHKYWIYLSSKYTNCGVTHKCVIVRIIIITVYYIITVILYITVIIYGYIITVFSSV